MTNQTGGTITIDALRIDWDSSATRILDEILDVNQIGNANETSSPSIFPVPNAFLGPVNWREINGGTMETLTVNFLDPPTGGSYTIEVHFDIGCRVSGTR